MEREISYELEPIHFIPLLGTGLYSAEKGLDSVYIDNSKDRKRFLLSHFNSIFSDNKHCMLYERVKPFFLHTRFDINYF